MILTSIGTTLLGKNILAATRGMLNRTPSENPYSDLESYKQSAFIIYNMYADDIQRGMHDGTDVTALKSLLYGYFAIKTTCTLLYIALESSYEYSKRHIRGFHARIGMRKPKEGMTDDEFAASKSNTTAELMFQTNLLMAKMCDLRTDIARHTNTFDQLNAAFENLFNTCTKFNRGACDFDCVNTAVITFDSAILSTISSPVQPLSRSDRRSADAVPVVI